MIRVTVTYLCTAAGWSDNEIMTFMNWQSHESLNRYRHGADLVAIRSKKSFASIWSDSEEAEAYRKAAEAWANLYQKKF